MRHQTTDALDFEQEQLRELDEVGMGIADDLAEMATALYDGTLASIPGAHDWLTGRHEGWGDQWGELPDRLRDRMERAAGDLAMGWPQSTAAASTALRDAAALIEESMEC